MEQKEVGGLELRENAPNREWGQRVGSFCLTLEETYRVLLAQSQPPVSCNYLFRA